MDLEQRVWLLAHGYAQVLLDDWDLCPCIGNETVLARRMHDAAEDTIRLCLSVVDNPDALGLMMDICAQGDNAWAARNRKCLSRGLHKVGAAAAMPREKAEDAGAAPSC